MRRRVKVAIVAALTTVSVLGTAGAEAATRVGNECVANSSAPSRTSLSLSSAGGTAAPKVPADGIVTGWTTRVEPGRGPLEQRLQTFRQLGHTNAFIAMGASDTETVVAGVSDFSTRIPVEAGDRVGLYGPLETFFCDREETDTSALLEAEAPVGFIQDFDVRRGVGTPVVAVVEPDADGDGYGDESQDECPRSAASQTRCPPVKMGVTAVAGERSILLRVSAAARVSIQVFGQVGWGYKPKPPHHTTRLIIALRGGTKGIVPGRVVEFRIRLPRLVLRRLGRLTPDESLKAKIALIATDRAGVETARRLTVKLRGRRLAGNLRG